MKKNLLTLLLMSFLSCVSVFAQQNNKMKKVYLSDGSVITANVEKQSDGTYKLTIEDGSVFIFQENEISFSKIKQIFHSQPSNAPEQSEQGPITNTVQRKNGDKGETDIPDKNVPQKNQLTMCPKHNGHEYVDLGLSVKWATCNIGSENSEIHSSYFMWGDIAANFNCSWATYKYCVGSGKNQTKYSTQKKSGFKGFIDNRSELELCDDAAHVIWGGEWRMPTIYEMRELQTRCSWTWGKINGINGYKVTSRVPGYEGQYIFLPAVGSCSDGKVNGVMHEGAYWSNTLEADDPENAHVLKFNMNNINVDWTDNRCDGHTIRPVWK